MHRTEGLTVDKKDLRSLLHCFRYILKLGNENIRLIDKMCSE